MQVTNYYPQIIAAMAEDNGTHAWANTGAMAAGFIQYTYCIYLTHSDGKGPFPLWQHLFYLAHDTIQAYHMAIMAPEYGYHRYFVILMLGLPVWSVLEVHCIYRAITVEREGVFARTRSSKQLYQAFIQKALLLLLFCTIFIMLGPYSYPYTGLVTNMVMAIAPGTFWLERGSRTGTRLGLAIVIILGTINTFNPYSQWVLELPSVFHNSFFYWIGVFCSLSAVYNCYILANLPATEKEIRKRA